MKYLPLFQQIYDTSNCIYDKEKDSFQDVEVNGAYQLFKQACKITAQTCVDICKQCVYKTGDFEYNRGRMACASEISRQFLNT